jgi:hypothetical protein
VHIDNLIRKSVQDKGEGAARELFIPGLDDEVFPEVRHQANRMSRLDSSRGAPPKQVITTTSGAEEEKNEIIEINEK